MVAALHSIPASGSIEHIVTACEFTATGVASNTSTGYDDDNYPASPAVAYYFSLEKSGSDSLVSPVFVASADGTAEWHDVIPPAAGTWTLHLRKVADDSSAANLSLVVS
jgi:hypothetical protein